MQFRLPISSLMLGLLAATAWGQDPPHTLLLRSAAPVPPGTTIIPAGVVPIDQLVIPRYADGKNPPAGQVLGWGAASRIVATAATRDQPHYRILAAEPYLHSTNQAVPAVVVTQDAEVTGMSQWQNRGNASVPAVMWPVVKDVAIQGHDDTRGEYSTRGSVAGNPQSGNRRTGVITAIANTTPIRVKSPSHSLVTGAVVRIDGAHASVDGEYTITRTSVAENGRPNSRDYFTLDGTKASGEHVGVGQWESLHWRDLYHGLVLRGTGVRVENVRLFYIPGTALTVSRPQSPRVGQPHPFDTGGKLVCRGIFIFRAYRGIDFRATDGIIGQIDVSNVRDYGIRFTNAVQIDGAIHTYGGRIGCWWPPSAHRCWGGPFYCEQSPIGMLIEARGLRLDGVYTHTNATAGIRITNSDNAIVNFESVGTPGQVAQVEILERAAKLTHGSFAMVSGGPAIKIGPNSRQGQDSGRGHYLDKLTFGAPGVSDAVCIQPQVQLNGCRIDFHIHAFNKAKATGIDFNYGGTSRLGAGNDINITTHATGGAQVTPVVFPARWDDKSNNIYVNGVRQLSR